MSINYASGLSKYENKGICGTPEIFDEEDKLNVKIELLANLIENSKHCVLYVGAGLSTSAGIPDFRGPNGVWTKEKEKESLSKKKIKACKDEDSCLEATILPEFGNCLPTFSHRAIRALVQRDIVKFIVSQNVDGLFVKDGINRKHLAELHGNFFVDECSHCLKRFIRNRSSLTMGCKSSGDKCPRKRPCRGMLHDTILDWEQPLPEKELIAAENASNLADLAICLGTTLQIEPAGSLPLKVKKNRKRKSKSQHNGSNIDLKIIKTESNIEIENGSIIKEEIDDKQKELTRDGKLVIVNLQKTKFDSRADLVIHHYLDKIFEMLCKKMNITVPNYDPKNDPTLSTHSDLKPFER